MTKKPTSLHICDQPRAHSRGTENLRSSQTLPLDLLAKPERLVISGFPPSADPLARTPELP